MLKFFHVLYIDTQPVNVQKLMRVLEASAKPGERDGDLRAQALVYTAVAGAYAETEQPVKLEWIIETLRFSRSRVSGAVTALFRKGLVDREEGVAVGKGRYYVYWPSSGPIRARQRQVP